MNGTGVVRARDIDKDGIDAAWLAEYLRTLGARRDPRLFPGGYVIFNRRITTPDFSGWKAYTGTNPHTAHVHVSFSTTPSGFDSAARWGIASATPPTPAPEDDMPLSQDDANMVAKTVWNWVMSGQEPYLPSDRAWVLLRETRVKSDQLAAALDALARRPVGQVDTAPIVAAVIDAVARAGVAQQVLDGLAARLSAKPV